MTTTTSALGAGGLLATILSDESFRPAEPQSIKETGLNETIVEGLIIKYLNLIGSSSGRNIADHIAIPFGLIEPMFAGLRNRQLLAHSGSAQLNDYVYTLTEAGRDRARRELLNTTYVGPAPVPLEDYLVSVEAQTIRAESPQRRQLEAGFANISVEDDLFDNLGPAINSGAGLFLYGFPGNGKTTLAKCITKCYGQDIWIPQTIIEDGQHIKLYDAAYHELQSMEEGSLLKSNNYDRRWVKIKRPTVVVGGELTMDALEMRHDPRSNVSEAPLQLKSNCGCLLIDDFGRQRMEPQELLNRWIVPLESRVDFLTLATGKKIEVPFEQLVIFSTNLDPQDLTDDAFLRRIPYKIEVGDPSRDEFHTLFQVFSKQIGCDYDRDAVDYLIDTHYLPKNRPLRRCQPRDLLSQIGNYCRYKGLPLEMRKDYFDRVVSSYFTVVAGT
ncbi:MAG: AAA family ATPase [bacterium]|nr:AAA family ATPase [bacterium]